MNYGKFYDFKTKLGFFKTQFDLFKTGRQLMNCFGKFQLLKWLNGKFCANVYLFCYTSGANKFKNCIRVCIKLYQRQYSNSFQRFRCWTVKQANKTKKGASTIDR